MAKKNKNKKVPLTPEQREERLDQKSAQRLLGKNTRGASYIANKFFAPGSLGRVSEGVTYDEKGNPIRIDENQDVINRFKALNDLYGRGPEGRSTEQKDVMSRMQSSLQGYEAPELLAMKEQAQGGIDTRYQTALRNFMQNQGRFGVRGASALAQQQNLERSRDQQQRELGRDIFIKGADEKQRRLEDYGTYVKNLEGDEAGRARTLGVDYATTLQNMQTGELDRQKLNLQQLAAERAGQLGTYFETLGTGETRRSRRKGEKLAKRALDIMAQSVGAGMGAGGGPDYQAYLQDKENAINKYG